MTPKSSGQPPKKPPVIALDLLSGDDENSSGKTYGTHQFIYLPLLLPGSEIVSSIFTSSCVTLGTMKFLELEL